MCEGIYRIFNVCNVPLVNIRMLVDKEHNTYIRCEKATEKFYYCRSGLVIEDINMWNELNGKFKVRNARKVSELPTDIKLMYI